MSRLWKRFSEQERKSLHRATKSRDKLEREQFTKKYQEMHRLARESDGTTVLYIGAENWPFPIRLVSENGAWYFDSKTGTQEILFRRIGENETTAIEVCEEFALTKTEDDAKAASNAKAASQDPITRFAQSLLHGANNVGQIVRNNVAWFK